MRQLISVWLDDRGEPLQANVSTYDDIGQLAGMETWAIEGRGAVGAFVEALGVATRHFDQRILFGDAL